jgi:KTSC domain
MPKVNSKAVDEVDYTPQTRTLAIKYKGGERYFYLRVPPQQYRALLDAPSIGAFVNREIKPRYAYQRKPWQLGS